MEGVALNLDFWRGRRVLLTGHTGFKGGWLALWLLHLGAQVKGYALPAEAGPSLWQVLRLDELISCELADLSDLKTLTHSVASFQPEIVLHLAAQPLVREAYKNPIATFSSNVMGTINLLEAVRSCPSVRAVVVVTTDKCYENKEWLWPYRENDSLGGYDPYSSSKACVELIASSWRNSYLRAQNIALATARAGNVIGGGDWARDRLLPDVFRTWGQGQALRLRYPRSTRPWQHVLEPLDGYLRLAQALFVHGDAYAEAWNFGPDANGIASVESVVELMAQMWPIPVRWVVDNQTQPHEAGLLALDASKAKHRLDWQSRWTLHAALEKTVAWHQAWLAGGNNMRDITLQQIKTYQDLLS